MKVINVDNLHEAVAECLPWMLDNAESSDSRNGPVLVAPYPVVTVYHKPKEHVLFGDARDANPFFHLMEALWMLDGRNDLAFPQQFNSKFGQYSDDGKTLWGAYGFRWREYFGYDQLEFIAKELADNPQTRRAVLSMWNGMYTQSLVDMDDDLHKAVELGSKDVPCNTHAYFEVRNGKLNMTICNRSNDAIWGAYGANAVHMSLLLEYMAEQVGVEMGVYRQFSNNFHIYTDIYDAKAIRDIAADAANLNLYKVYKDMPTVKLMSYHQGWREDLQHFLDTGEVDSSVPGLLGEVAEPMYRAWKLHKSGDTLGAQAVLLDNMPYCDWQIAGLDWLKRRHEAKKEKRNATAA